MKKTRKQVYKLTLADLEKHAIWEFALDEEGEAGQDEATVRPWRRAEPLDPADGMFVVRANFMLADGSRLVGYLTPPVQGDDSIGTIQPILVTGRGQIGFWCGAFPPESKTIAAAYKKLGRKPKDVFPCRYTSDVEIMGGPISGTVNGFMHYRSLRTRSVKVVK